MWGLFTIGFLLSFLWTLLALPKVASFAIQRQWYDMPSERKVHVKPIVAIGGVGIFTGFWLIFFCLSNFDEVFSMACLMLGSTILFLMSLWDDVKNLRPIIRLLGQLLVASICFVGGFKIEGLYGFFGIGEVADLLQYVLTVLLIMTVINAYNLIDGVNGLSGSLSLLTCLVFCVFFWSVGNNYWALMSIILGGGVLGFLKYNFGNASMFMGDNGATFLGLMFALFCIKFLSFYEVAELSLNNLIGMLSIISLPVLDLIRVSVSRMANGKSPFFADRTHIHHLLLDSGKSHSQIAIRLSLLQFFLFAFAQIIFSSFTPLTLLLSVVFLYLGYIVLLKISLGLTAIKAMEYERKELNLVE